MVFFINHNSLRERALQTELTNLSFFLLLASWIKYFQKTMMNTKKLIKMAKKWQQRAALQRRRISFPRSSASTSSSTAIEKGCFVVYTTRFT